MTGAVEFVHDVNSIGPRVLGNTLKKADGQNPRANDIYQRLQLQVTFCDSMFIAKIWDHAKFGTMAHTHILPTPHFMAVSHDPIFCAQAPGPARRSISDSLAASAQAMPKEEKRVSHITGLLTKMGLAAFGLGYGLEWF